MPRPFALAVALLVGQRFSTFDGGIRQLTSGPYAASNMPIAIS
jgi:hypothetical protein